MRIHNLPRFPWHALRTWQTDLVPVNSSDEFISTWLPRCEAFNRNPPSDLGEREKERKRLTEHHFIETMRMLDEMDE